MGDCIRIKYKSILKSKYTQLKTLIINWSKSIGGTYLHTILVTACTDRLDVLTIFNLSY